MTILLPSAINPPALQYPTRTNYCLFIFSLLLECSTQHTHRDAPPPPPSPCRPYAHLCQMMTSRSTYSSSFATAGPRTTSQTILSTFSLLKPPSSRTGMAHRHSAGKRGNGAAMQVARPTPRLLFLRCPVCLSPCCVCCALARPPCARIAHSIPYTPGVIAVLAGLRALCCRRWQRRQQPRRQQCPGSRSGDTSPTPAPLSCPV